MPDIVIPDLSDNQAVAILTEALNAGIYESSVGVPDDEKKRLHDAEAVVHAVKTAYNANNRSDVVTSIIRLSETNITSQTEKEQPQISFDFSQITDEVLDQLIAGFDNYVSTPALLAEKEACLAEKEKRQNAEGTQEIKAVEEEPQIAEPVENSEASQSSDLQIPSEESQVDDQISGSGESSGGGNTEVSVVSESTSADASAFVRVQTVTESPEGGQAQAQPNGKDSQDKQGLLAQITIELVETHKIDPLKVADLSAEDLEYIINNPQGPAKADMEILVNPKEKTALAGIEDKSRPEKIVTKENMGVPIVANETTKSTSEYRESLEAQITGPMLKAYQQGRRSIPDMTDEQILLMISHPHGNISKETWDAAGKKVDKEVSTPKVEIPKADKEETPAQKMMREAQELDAKEKEEAAKKAEQERLKKSAEEEAKHLPIPKGTIQSNTFSAMEIIERERFPIPPEITQDPPILPFDVSKCSREEIYSFHAQFHACESRANWVLSNVEDELGDFEKIKDNREVEVYNSIPFEINGKKVTNDYRDATVAADTQVIELGNKIREKQKIVNKIRVLQRNFHLDCERLSRQISKWETEKKDLPR